VRFVAVLRNDNFSSYIVVRVDVVLVRVSGRDCYLDAVVVTLL